MHSLPLADLDALFLDAGNTLVGMDPALVCDRLAAHGIAAEPAEVERAEAGARPALSRLLARGRSSEDRDTFVFHIRNAIAALPAVGAGGVGDAAREAELDRIAHAVAHELKDAGTRRLWSRVLPGVPQALASLHAAGVKLAVVSNSDGTIEAGMAAVGLRDHLDAVFDSRVVGFEKPDARIFIAALEKIGTRPERTAHLGDLHAVDVLGARGAGVHGVLVDPFDDWRDDPCPRTRSTAELARALLDARAARR
ncbi:HAD-IA family hydrolase [Candidatus Binatia bacterium]|nr:HAD-IA family hydrolase [Candidatus Binatia bacterium]